jgi:A/G-specific adenine glycosylase
MAKKIAQVSLRRLWIERKGALLLHRKAADSRQLAGMCELPDATLLPAAKIDPKPLTIKRRTITNQSFTESIHRAALRASTPDPTLDESSGLIWATPRQLARLTLSGPHRRWIEELRKDSKTSHH